MKILIISIQVLTTDDSLRLPDEIHPYLVLFEIKDSEVISDKIIIMLSK